MNTTKLQSLSYGVIVMLTLSSVVCTWPAYSNENPPVDRSGKIRWAFNTLDLEHMFILKDFYHDDAHFIDPVVDAKGLEKIRAHYEHQYKSVVDIRFTIVDEHISGDTHTLEWEMELKTKRLNKGQKFSVSGASVITFSGDKVSYHRDFFDLGDMLYERLPIIGYVTKKIKKRLHFKEENLKK